MDLWVVGKNDITIFKRIFIPNILLILPKLYLHYSDSSKNYLDSIWIYYIIDLLYYRSSLLLIWFIIDLVYYWSGLLLIWVIIDLVYYWSGLLLIWFIIDLVH